jgi:hypothetical protein
VIIALFNRDLLGGFCRGSGDFCERAARLVRAGLFMAMGWVLGRLIMEWLIGLISRHRNRARDFVGLRRNR